MSHAGSRSPGASLGLLDATMVGIGAMIGAGIFVLTGLAAETAGPAALLVFGLNGSVTLFTALSYAELASAIPRNGGGYVYVRETFSGAVSFVMGWTRWFTYMAAGGLYALGFSSNFVEFVHLYVPSAPDAPIAYALAIVVLFVTLNALSTEASGGAETVITLLKIAILGVFVAFGVFAVETGEFSPFFPADGGARTVLPAMGLTFIAFQGYDLIATVTEEVENPQKNIPRAIFLSLAATVVIYLLVVMVAIGTLGAGRVQRQYFRADDGGAGSRPSPSRCPRAIRRDAHRHGRAQNRIRLHQGDGARRRRGRSRQLGDAGDRLSRDAGL